MRSHAAVRPLLGAVLAILLEVCGAASPGAAAGKSTGMHSSYRKPHPINELDAPRIVLGGGEASPTSFPSGWKRAIGWSIGYLEPIRTWCDFAVDYEKFQHHYDDSKLRAKGATTVTPPGQANFRDLAFGFHVHPPALGSRIYGLLELALPRVERPAVFYSDASGAHEQGGVDQSGRRFGGAVGLGFEQIPYGHTGSLIEARYVVDPVPGSRTVNELVIRAALTVPLPTR